MLGVCGVAYPRCMAIKMSKRARLKYRKQLAVCKRARVACLDFFRPMATRGLDPEDACAHTFAMCMARARRARR